MRSPIRPAPARNGLVLAQSEALRELARRSPDPQLVQRHEPPLVIEVDRERARFSTWYEIFPRSAGATPGAHGTFADVRGAAALRRRDGLRCPVSAADPSDRRRPSARARTTAPARRPTIPEVPGPSAAAKAATRPCTRSLGTLEDFRRLLASAGALGIEIALDIAFQCAPDHPYVREHPEWFLKRPDGTIQYAENPPKKYQDIYPFWFECDDWRALWAELKSVFEFWIAQGVRIFRVDNPHTKPFAFWEWVIARESAARTRR